MIYPQNRDYFSIAVEQSISTVLGLAWSPSGLAQFRRSVLAVLTSNLILSLWEPVGAKGQWARVGIVNHVFHPDSATLKDLTGVDLRRFNIRSFQWCSPLYVPRHTNGSNSLADPENRWGVHFLTVATDANEVALLRVRRLAGLQASTQPYHVEKLAIHFMRANGSHFSKTCTGSLLHSALQHKARITSVSCGPWLDTFIANEHGAHFATAVIAVVYGTQLRLVKATVALSESDPNREVIPRYEASSEMKDHPLASLGDARNQYRITGPLQWIHTVCDAGHDNDLFTDCHSIQNQSKTIGLAVGVIGGLVTILVPRSTYGDSVTQLKELETGVWNFSCLSADGDEGPPKRPLEPISGKLNLFRDRNLADSPQICWPCKTSKTLIACSTLAL